MSVQQQTRPSASPAKVSAQPGVSADDDRRRQSRRVSTAAAMLGIGVAVMMYGGYDKGWSWTGVDASKTLWDWLQMLLLPVAFATLPLAMRRRRAMSKGRKQLLWLALVVFATFVVCGYLVPWQWTGFGDNTLWDWISLVLLPVTIISVRFVREERDICARHRVAAGVLVVGMLALVACGYLLRWAWTGFEGNTLFDWVKLLLLPVLFPTVIVPTVSGWLTREQARAEKEADGDAVSPEGRGPNS